jgi:hypothetical protein
MLRAMRRLRSWLDPTAPSSTPVGIASAVASTAAATLLINPLKRLVDAASLYAVYIQQSFSQRAEHRIVVHHEN